MKRRCLMVSPVHIVNYKLDDDSPPLLNEDKRKMYALNHTKVVYLLYIHNSESEVFKSHCIFHEKVIEQLYEQADILLVEENSKNKMNQLHCNFIPHLDLTKYLIQGWVDPQVSAEAYKIYELADQIKEAIETILKVKQTEKLNMAWRMLIDYAKIQGIEALPNVEIIDQDPTKLTGKKSEFIIRCKIQVEKMKMNFIYDSFKKNQNSLYANVHGNEDKKRIIVLMGKNHGHPADKKIIPIVNEFFEKHEHSFVVIDPSNG